MGIKYLVFLNVWCLVCSPELCQGLERREWEKLVTYCAKTYTVSACNPSVYCQIIPLFQGNFRYSVTNDFTVFRYIGIL